MHRQQENASVSTALERLIAVAIARNGGWLPFDRYMALALYAPGLGYYAAGDRQFGLLPGSGSDFVTAPELSPLFGQALGNQVRQALEASDTDEVWEFGAGSGELAAQLLEALGPSVRTYSIVDVSGALRARQRERLAVHADRVRWLDALPESMSGVVVGNEVLDAMPVQLLHHDGAGWNERGVTLGQGGGFAWADRPTQVRPPAEPAPKLVRSGAPRAKGGAGEIEVGSEVGIDVGSDVGSDVWPSGMTTELHLQAQAFIGTLADRLERGAAFFIDYGFPAAEYYHPQRSGGTLMCHRAHRADTDPLVEVGRKDITAHVDFSAIALAAQDAGLDVIGYTSQARFLMNCGILESLEGADLRTIAHAQKLLTEHEMGELFKVLALAKGCDFAPLGFTAGDRSHTL